MTIRLAARILPFALSLALAAPGALLGQIEEPRIPLQTKLSEINRFRAEYADNYNRKDLTAVVAMYSADIIVVNPEGRVFKGIEATRADLQSSMPWPHLVIESDSVTVYGNTAVDIGTTRLHPANGGEVVTRYMVILRRDMNGWKLVREAITPVGPQSGM